ncbi:DNA-methyltransferase [Ralstonia solanacearum]|uniref:DNA-methyltransferase n=1 Tax=Ralstonia solanacearum TaxID=305 RepID=UPI00202A3737|nr:site-specific DNA-methyltransferase [Ralstonia solanacearum]MCL9854341.1 site-specific DNA-methyltransferase [Ralstonia solanacearum]
MKLNHLHRSNALDVLRGLPDASVDMLFTDPPYSSGGLHAGTRAQAPQTKYIHSDVRTQYATFGHDNKDQRSWTFWCMTWLAEAYRASKDGGYLVCFTDWRQLPSLTDAVQGAGYIWRGVAVWDKTPGRARPRSGGFSAQAEFMVWATKGAVPANNKTHLPGVFAERLALPKRHMTEKPMGLAREVVRLVPPGSVVCDPFAGSGTFLVAAQEAGHQWIGCELEPAYHELAVRRLAASRATSQDAAPLSDAEQT